MDSHGSTYGMDTSPQPVSFMRLIEAVEAINPAALLRSDFLEIPERHWVTTIRVEERKTPRARIVVEATSRRQVDWAEAPRLTEVLNGFNRERLIPTFSSSLYSPAAGEDTTHHSTTSDSSIEQIAPEQPTGTPRGELLDADAWATPTWQVVARVIIPVGVGMAESQLLTFFSFTLSAIEEGFTDLVQIFPELICPRQEENMARLLANTACLADILVEDNFSDIYPEDILNALPTDADELTGSMNERFLEAADDNSHTYPATALTVERLRRRLADIGVKNVLDQPGGMVALINGVATAFSLDHGNYLRIRSQWDTELQAPEELGRVHLVCNDYNGSNSATTFLEVNEQDQHIHGRAEVSLPLAAGVNQAQLTHFLGYSLRECLKAVDVISQELHGRGEVDWPGAGR